MPTTTVTWTIFAGPSGTDPNDVKIVLLVDPTGTFGIKRDDTGEIIAPANTVLTPGPNPGDWQWIYPFALPPTPFLTLSGCRKIICSNATVSEPFVIGPFNKQMITLPTPGSIDQAVIGVRCLDQSGNPDVGVPVEFRLSGAQGTDGNAFNGRWAVATSGTNGIAPLSLAVGEKYLIRRDGGREVGYTPASSASVMLPQDLIGGDR